jgi:hypothetical protein
MPIRISIAKPFHNKALRMASVSGVLGLSLVISVAALAVAIRSEASRARSLVALAHPSTSPDADTSSTPSILPSSSPKTSSTPAAGVVKGASTVASDTRPAKASQSANSPAPSQHATIAPTSTPAPTPAPTIVGVQKVYTGATGANGGKVFVCDYQYSNGQVVPNGGGSDFPPGEVVSCGIN